MPGPRIVIAAPIYGQVQHLREVLGSLLRQTYEDMALLAVDDCSPDASAVVARELADGDRRVDLVVNDRRLGMLRNTNRAYALARERHPDAEYFALASDHDIWEPHWLERLVTALDENPAAVLAYPLSERIDASGRAVSGSWRFATAAVDDPRTRLRRALTRMVSGDMIYGLLRTSVLPPDRLYQPVLAPDRLLLSELALRGEFIQVEELLWRRRFVGLAALSRQRHAFWPDGGAPITSYLPWWIVHTGIAARRYGSLLAFRDYLPASVAFQLRSRAVRARNAVLVPSVKAAIRSPAGRRLVRTRVLPALRETREVLDRLSKDAE
jgi:glycosyltransferase involved in cell wall biosynthesis